MIGGYLANIGQNLKFKPTVLLRYAINAPISAEITGQFIIKDKLWIGGMYRLNESAGAILGLQVSKQIRLGYAYDYSLSKLSGYDGGTHEIMVNYIFSYKNKVIIDPIYF